MNDWCFPPPERPAIPVVKDKRRFPVNRIFCVAQNYAKHALEMGSSGNQPPFFFMKPACALRANPGTLPYPDRTKCLHYEGELVVALRKGGADIAVDKALDHVFGYCCGVDLTRRDLQKQAKKDGKPWDSSKGFDASAPTSAITPAEAWRSFADAQLQLSINSVTKQAASLRDMILPVGDIIAHLSRLWTLAPGDLIFTGTPEGVGPILPGDLLQLTITGLEALQFRIKAQ